MPSTFISTLVKKPSSKLILSVHVGRFRCKGKCVGKAYPGELTKLCIVMEVYMLGEWLPKQGAGRTDSQSGSSWRTQQDLRKERKTDKGKRQNEHWKQNETGTIITQNNLFLTSITIILIVCGERIKFGPVTVFQT